MISAPRVLSWHSDAQMLVANPTAEIELLHNATLCDLGGVKLQPDAKPQLLQGCAGTAIDLNLEFVLPPQRDKPLQLTVRVFASDASPYSGGSPLVLTVSPSGNVSSCYGDQYCGSFQLLPSDQNTLTLRALVDRSAIEWFSGGGRAVQTVRAYPEAAHSQVTVELSGGQSVELRRVVSHEMGCGWTSGVDAPVASSQPLKSDDHPCVGKDGSAKASCFGFDPSDSTDFLQKAFASGASMLTIDVVKNPAGQPQPWIVRPLILNSSNIAIHLQAEVTILAKQDEFHGLDDSMIRIEARIFQHVASTFSNVVLCIADNQCFEWTGLRKCHTERCAEH